MWLYSTNSRAKAQSAKFGQLFIIIWQSSNVSSTFDLKIKAEVKIADPLHNKYGEKNVSPQTLSNFATTLLLQPP